MATTDLPLALVPDLLTAVQRQTAAERNAAETEVVARLLAERDAELLALLRKKRAGQRVIEVVSEFLEADRARRGTLTPAREDREKGGRQGMAVGEIRRFAQRRRCPQPKSLDHG